jgi:hypothetical protein
VLGGLVASGGSLAGGMFAADALKLLFSIMAWTAGVGSVIAGAANIPKLIQEHERRRGKFALYSARFRMLLGDIKARANDWEEKYLELRDESQRAIADLPSDPLVTKTFLARVESDIQSTFRKEGLIK